MQDVEECLRESGPVLAGERYESAHHRRLQASDRGAEPLRYHVARQEGDSESGGGEVGSGRHLAGLHSCARNEAGRGASAVSVAIDPAPFRGVLPLPISALRSGRGHSLTIDHGWREVADIALAFVERFVKP